MKISNLTPFLIAILGAVLVGCGGGKSSSSAGSEPAAPVIVDPVTPPPVTVGGVAANDCMSDIQVRTNRTALVHNICGYAINVGQMDSRFPAPPPITLINPGQIKAMDLADDQLTVGLGACRAPSIPTPSSPGFFTCSSYTQGKASKREEYSIRYSR